MQNWDKLRISKAVVSPNDKFSVGLWDWKASRGGKQRMMGEILVKDLRGQHAGRGMSQDVQVTGRDGMSQEEGESSSEEALTK